MFIQSVDPSKPVGKLVLDFADRYWWKGLWTGIGVGMICSLSFYQFTKFKSVDSLFRR